AEERPRPRPPTLRPGRTRARGTLPRDRPAEAHDADLRRREGRARAPPELAPPRLDPCPRRDVALRNLLRQGADQRAPLDHMRRQGPFALRPDPRPPPHRGDAADLQRLDRERGRRAPRPRRSRVHAPALLARVQGRAQPPGRLDRARRPRGESVGAGSTAPAAPSLSALAVPGP